jgi:flagellar basal body-associated protein FliL
MTASSVFSRRTALAALLMAVASPALASSKKKEEKKGEGEAPAPEPVIKMQPFAAPIVEDGKLVNYIFLNLSLKLAEGVPVTVLAGQEPSLRDAIVRAAYRTPFNKADTYNEIDEVKLRAAVLREAATVVGKGKISSVEITKQIARKQLPPPRPAKPATSTPSAPPPTRGRDIVP